MPFQLTILGSNSAVPAHGRFTTAQVLQVKNKLYLIDCGEATQSRLGDSNISRRERIEQIFISHLHGDHVFGLPGLLTSFSLNQRKNPLTIYSPAGLQEMIEAIFKYSYSHLSYDLKFVVVPTDKSVQIFENKDITVTTIPLDHRIPTTGYLFREKEKVRNIRPKKIEEYGIHYSKINAIKEGGDFTAEDGRIIPNEELTMAPPLPRSFAFCSDTTYQESIVSIIKGVDLLYHETTYLDEAKENAVKYGHSTAKQAATIAKMANVGKLVCGHYSSRYQKLDALEAEAKSIFPNSELGLEGKCFMVTPRRIE
ncbi:MAG: ribonuclease Z [Saprospiraceae bacterium]|jgi:ribonuclease Z